MNALSVKDLPAKALALKPLAVVRQTVAEFGQDNGPTLAAAIAYYTLLSIFPLILGLLALFGAFISDPATQSQLIADVAGLFPGAASLIEQTVAEVVRGRQAAGIVATLGLVWSASGVFGGINQALNQIWKVHEQRNAVANALLAVGLVFGVGVIFVASLLVSTAIQVATSFDLPVLGISLGSVPGLLALIGVIVPVFFAFGVFAFIYRFVPNLKLTWRDVWPGALFASAIFEVGKQAFSWYLGNFAHYNAVYGSIGAVIALVTWAYYAALVILLGAELNHVLAKLRNEAATREAERGGG